MIMGPSGFIALLAGWITTESGRQPYTVYGLLRTSDFATLGTLNTGAYPVELAFSPDDQVAYTYIDTGGIKTYSTSTFLSIGPNINGVGSDLFVDASGRYLFATSTGTTVYDTGRTVPEPGSGGVMGVVGLLMLRRKRLRPLARGSVAKTSVEW